jgi:hypothetical protein
MFSYFPQIRDQESTYSIFSRLQFALQPPNYEIMGNMLFNRRFEVGRLNFQGSFDYLCSNLPSRFTSELFFYNNTIFPLFIPFISYDKHKKALGYFKGNYPDKISKFLSISDIINKKKYIRVCKECIKDDFTIYGEPYYRRQHEIELNRMCYKHKCPLYEYIIFPYKIPERYADYYTVLSNSKQISIPEEFKERFLDIAEDINTIFASNLSNCNIDITINKISNRIAEKGYVTINGKTLQKRFRKDFKKYYTEQFLDYIEYNFDLNKYDTWIFHTITRKNFSGNPLKFILVIRYLFGSFKDFYQYNKEYSLFKKGPYPCLNSVCPNYKKLVIKDIMQINISYGYQVATFLCEHCGFKYSRRGPDKNDNDIYNKTHVKDYGHLWHDKLKECVTKGYSITKMSKTLNCTTLDNLKIEADKYKNSSLVENPKILLNKEPNKLLLEQYKSEVLSFIKENPGNATKQKIYRFRRKAYYYLSENASEWIHDIVTDKRIFATLNFVKKNETISKEDKPNNYWLKKDDLLVRELLKAADKIKSEKTPYKRITIDILKKYTGYYDFYNNRIKLPKCSQILYEICETVIVYQKRRIDHVIMEMANNSDKITIYKVFHKSGIRASRTSQEVQRYIEDKVKEYTKGSIIIEENNTNCR